MAKKIKVEEYNYVCGICGYGYIKKPKKCKCGNNAVFYKTLTNWLGEAENAINTMNIKGDKNDR